MALLLAAAETLLKLFEYELAEEAAETALLLATEYAEASDLLTDDAEAEATDAAETADWESDLLADEAESDAEWA